MTATDHPKFQAIVEAGKRLFWKYGVKRVALKEICREAETSKVTFYRFFANKIALAQYLLDQVLEEGLELYRSIIAQPIPFIARL